MRLLSLSLQNFKGHKNLDIHFKDITRIIGANGSGKTSVFDAWMFVLTGKDSLGRVCGTGQKGEATIRPRQADGELVRGVDISVTAKILDEDGEVHTLQRIFCEVYAADRNSGNKLFKGNTTKYFINEVPTPANKYDAWVKEHIDPERLRLTGDPAYFPSMSWQDQRKWLLQIAGDVTDTDVLASDPELKPLENLLARHSIEDVKAMASAQLKLANKTVKDDMVRIDQTIKLAGNATEPELAAQISQHESMVKAQEETVAQAESALTNARNGNRAGQVQNQLDAQKNKVEAWELRRHNKIVAIKDEFRNKAASLQTTIRGAEEGIKTKRQQMASLTGLIQEAEARKEELYKRYDAEDAQEFKETECPFCHQPLPADKVEQLRAEFNNKKGQMLEAIVAEGKKVAARENDLDKERDALALAVEAEEKKKTEAQQSLDGIVDAENAALAALPQLEDIAEFREERAKRDMLKRELDNIMKGDQPDLEPLRENLREARAILDSLHGKLAGFRANLGILRSVADLQDDLQKQRENADAASDTLRLVTLYITTKCRMLTDNVNTLFPGLEWRLFTRNIGNDDIVETCELLMHGVNYRDLSAGEKIRAGLVIVDTLQEKLATQTPVFIDGAESITFTPEIKSQLILLKAQENIKDLVVEEA